MKKKFWRLWVLLPAALLGLFVLVTPAHADVSALNLTILTIEPLKPVSLGDHPVINVLLTNSAGDPIPNQEIRILVDGVRKAQAMTDSAGRVAIPLKYKFTSGQYEVQALYPGWPSGGMASARTTIHMTVEPATAILRTVPPLQGIRFRFNDHIYVSDENGEVNISVEKGGMYLLEILPVNPQSFPSNMRVEFTRWNEPVFDTYRVIYMPRTRPLEAGFTVSYQVSQQFFSTTGEPVDSSRISSISLRAIGRTYILNGAGPHWLPANQLARRIGERLQSQDILYYFRDVTISGINVINKSEQRFYARANDVWPVKVLLYSAHFSARDAMFKFPIGKGIKLYYPDGHTEVFTFDKNGEVDVPSLARGSYQAQVIGAGGSAPMTPVHLSQNQDTELLVLSSLDLAVILGIPGLLALILLIIGRPQLFSWVRTGVNLRGFATRVR